MAEAKKMFTSFENFKNFYGMKSLPNIKTSSFIVKPSPLSKLFHQIT
jgi:hypothetical protein